MLDTNSNSQIVSPTILKLQEEIKTNKIEAILKFWEKIENIGTPLFETIEEDSKYEIITFVFRKDEEVENVVCNSFFVKENIKEGLLETIKDTNIYYKSYKILKGIRDTYCLSKNNPLEPKDPSENTFKHVDLIFHDPLNSKKSFLKVDGISIPINNFESPDAPPQPYYGERVDIDHGEIQEYISYSEILDIKRKILVYTPPNYLKTHSPYHFLLLFDGFLFEEDAKVSSTLDNLIADEKIPPLVAIMVENFIPTNTTIRSYELPPNPRFKDYIIKELLPWVLENFNITKNPSHSVIAGASYGAIASTYIAFKHPDIFGNVLSMSGAYSWYPGDENWKKTVKNLEQFERWWTIEDEEDPRWLARQFNQNAKLPLKFYIDVGVLEVDDPTGLYQSNRHFYTILQSKGYAVYYTEFLGGHDFVCWRSSIADGLIYLIGKGM
ncbi:MAG: alpha/beta hydrolase [Promethearchaeota archaeon]